jgi:hypothetical protein
MIVRGAEFESVRNGRFWDTGIYPQAREICNFGFLICRVCGNLEKRKSASIQQEKTRFILLIFLSFYKAHSNTPCLVIFIRANWFVKTTVKPFTAGQ